MYAERIDIDHYIGIVKRLDTLRMNGKVVQAVGMVVESVGQQANIGELCHIITSRVKPPVPALVVGFREERTLLMPLGEMEQISPGNEVIGTGSTRAVPVGRGLLGRVLDGFGYPLDGKGAVIPEDEYPVVPAAAHPLQWQPVSEPLPLGIKAIDGLLTCGKGQRMGLYAGAGTGKEALCGTLARAARVNATVIAMIGHHGRAVGDFLQRQLGEAALARTVVVVATADQPAIQRVQSGMVATAIAEYLRDCGMDILLIVDSVTRLARAQREIGQAVGESPTAVGYPPSVFSLLPRFVERAGRTKHGSITGLYVAQLDEETPDDPIAAAMHDLLDGRIVLSHALASRGYHPAIDLTASSSELAAEITSPEHQLAAARLREMLAACLAGHATGIETAAHDISAFVTQAPGESVGWAQMADELRAFLRD